MSARFSSIEQAPRHVPNWHLMMEDLCQPAPEDLGRVLDLSKRSIQRFNAADRAPRAVELAVYWLTTWGRSQLDCQAVNTARVAVGYAQSLERQVRELQALVEQLRGLAQHGAANDPTSALSSVRKEDPTPAAAHLSPSPPRAPSASSSVNRAGGVVRWHKSQQQIADAAELVRRMAARDPLWMALSRPLRDDPQ